MRQRRRAERQQAARSASQATGSRRRISDRRAQRILYGVIAVAAIALIGLLSVGWWFNSYRPPRKVVAEFEGVAVQLKEVVPYTALTAPASGSLNPNTALSALVRNVILERRAAELEANVTPQDVDAELVRQFEPPSDDENAEPPASLSEEGRETLREFLDVFRVSDAEHRDWIAGELRSESALDYFAAQSPETAEQIYVEWIVAASSDQAGDARERLEADEELADVAAELHLDQALGDADGDLGWTPEGAFPADLERILFADDIEQGELQGPHTTTIGSVVFRVTDGPSEQPVSKEMRRLLGNRAFQQWLDERSVEVVYDFTQGDGEWTLRQLEDLQ